MSHSFNPKHGPILVDAEVTGPVRSMTLQLVLDTGATTSVLDEIVLSALGYDLLHVTDRAQMTTGSTATSVPKVVLTRLTTLGRHRFGLSVLAHTFPVSAEVRGLVGLDFLRDHVLTIDFPAGRITLT